MKILFLICALFLFNTSSAQFISEDDVLHFSAGAAVSSITYALVYSSRKNSKKAFWFSLGASALVGLSKEMYDEFVVDGRFNTGELISTITGGFVASYTFNIFTNKERKQKRKELAYSNL